MHAIIQKYLDAFSVQDHANYRGSRYVWNSPDLDRILNVPEVLPSTLDAPIEQLIRPTGDIQLRPKQREALVAAYNVKGLIAQLNVGEGKTLVAYLLPMVLNKSAVILAPASVVKQMKKMFAQYDVSFKGHKPPIQLLSYGKLSVESGQNELERYAPKLIIADEAVNLCTKHSARTKRFLRYMYENPDTIFCGLSASFVRTSIKEFSHLLRLGLKDLSPLPENYKTLQEWSEALDLDWSRHPGALEKLNRFVPAPYQTRLPDIHQTARRSWQWRYRTTAGVVTSEEFSTTAQLIVRPVVIPQSNKIAQALSDLGETWTRPDGEELVTALEVAELKRQLNLGGYYRWKEEPPSEWKEIRAEWHRELRAFLRYRSSKGLDSPLLVAKALRDGRYQHASMLKLLLAWDRVKNRFHPKTEWKWISYIPIENIAAQPSELFWVDIVAFGIELATTLNCRFHQNDKDLPTKAPAVCSIDALKRGVNLQHFHRNFVITPPIKGETFSQLIGRTFRQGQKSRKVIVEYPVFFAGDVKRAIQSSEQIENLTGVFQPLLHAANM